MKFEFKRENSKLEREDSKFMKQESGISNYSEISEENKNAIKNVEIANMDSYLATPFEVWCLGISVVLGGQLYGWNSGFSSGFGTFAMGQVIMGLAYIAYVLCLAECISAVPFAGLVFIV